MKKSKLRSFFSSRPVAGILFVLFLYSFVFFQKYSGSLGFPKYIFAVSEISLILPIVFWSVYEIFRLDERFKNRFFFMIISVLIILLPIFFLLFFYPGDTKPDIKFICSSLGISLVCMYLFSNLVYGKASILDPDIYCGKYSFRRLLLMSVVFWNSFFFSCFFLKYPILLILITASVLTDTFSYLFGRIFGKRRVFKASPRKTLEGFIFSIVVVPVICFFLFWFFIESSYSGLFKILILSLFSFFIVLFSALGDLFFSSQKRIFGVKDYGRMFGSHGGFWDRFDSHSFAISLGVVVSMLAFNGNA